MKKKSIYETTTSTGNAVRSSLLLSASLAMAACLPAVAKQDRDSTETHYRTINLVSDLPRVAQV